MGRTPSLRLWTVAGWIATGLGLCSASAWAASPTDRARIRFLIASGQPDRAAADSARVLRTSPEDAELVVLHVMARAALGEGASLAEPLSEEGTTPARLARVVALAEGVADSGGVCSDLDALLAEPAVAEHWGGLAPIWSRLEAICPEQWEESWTARGGALDGPDSLRTQLPVVSLEWGEAFEAWIKTRPPDLTRAGNPWAPGVRGPGLVRARLALSSEAERALASEEPWRVWWARDVVRWQENSTARYDERLETLDPSAHPVEYESGDGARWQVDRDLSADAAVYALQQAVGIQEPYRRMQALQGLDAAVPATGSLRARWWSEVAESHEALGHPRRAVAAWEEAWRAEPEVLDRANAFAWAAAEHRHRMAEALVAIDAVLSAPMPYRSDRGGPAADAAFRWNQGHSVGAALDTRAWLRFHMGDVSGARADLDRALMLYRAPSATVHFHAAIVAHADGADEVALFHVKQGFLVLNPQHDSPDLVAHARTLAEALYAERRWHPGGVDAWLAASEPVRGRRHPGSIVDLDAEAERLVAEPPRLPVQGGPLPELMVSRDGVPTLLDSVEGWKVVELWAAWCVNCHVQMGALETLHEEWTAAGVPVSVVVVSVEATERDQWPMQMVGVPSERWVLTWGGPTVLEQLGASGLPATLVVDPSGRVVQTRLGWEGSLDWLRDTLTTAGVWVPGGGEGSQ